MSKPKFQVGEWCFYEFKLSQVTKTEEGRITGVSDGVFSTGSLDLSDRCYPVEMKIKQASDEVALHSSKLYEVKKVGLNYPDIHRHLVSLWVDLCEATDENRAERYKRVQEFTRGITDRVQDIAYEKIDGVRVFGR